MQWQEFWLILGGFLLGLVISTLWEWFYFRRQRVEWHDAEVERLEAELRLRDEWIRLQQQASITRTRTETTTQQETTAGSGEAPSDSAVSAYAASIDYQSPPVFLGNEEAESLRGEPFGNAPQRNPYAVSSAASDETSATDVAVGDIERDASGRDTGPLPATSIYAPGAEFQRTAARADSPEELAGIDVPPATHVRMTIGDEEQAATDRAQAADVSDDVARAAVAAGLVAGRARTEQDAGDAFLDEDAGAAELEPGDHVVVIVNEDADDAATVVLDADRVAGSFDDEDAAPPVETEGIEPGDHVTVIVNEDADDAATVVLDADRVAGSFDDEDAAPPVETEAIEPGDHVRVIVNEDADDAATVVLDADRVAGSFDDEDAAPPVETEGIEPGDHVTVIVNEDADDAATVVLDAERGAGALDDEDAAPPGATESVEPGDHITLVLDDDNESSKVALAAAGIASVPDARDEDGAPPAESKGIERGDHITVVVDDDDPVDSGIVANDVGDTAGAAGAESDDTDSARRAEAAVLEAGDRVTIVLDADDQGGSSTVRLEAEDVAGAHEPDEERAGAPAGTGEFEPDNAAAVAADDAGSRAVVLDAEYVVGGFDAAQRDDEGGAAGGDAEPDAPAPGDRVTLVLDAEDDAAAVDVASAADERSAGGAFEPVGEEDERAPERLGFDPHVDTDEGVAARRPGVTIIVESAASVVIDEDQIGEEPEIGQYAFVPSVGEEAAAMAAWVESALQAARAEKARQEAAAEGLDDEAGAAGESDSERVATRSAGVILRDDDAEAEVADYVFLAGADAESESTDDIDLTALEAARLARATDQSTAGVYLESDEALTFLRAAAAGDLAEEESERIALMRIRLDETTAAEVDDLLAQLRAGDDADSFGRLRLVRISLDPAEDADDEHPDNLALIDGIGPTYRQRLYDHGVFTFYQVSLLDAAELEEITQAIAAADPAAWRKEANDLAAAYGRDNAVYAGPMPAELDAINGIDREVAQWLYMAGVHTFADLAARRPAELQALLAEGVNWREADAAKWVKRAAVLAKRQEASSA